MCYVPMIVMIDFAWKLRSVLLFAPLFHLSPHFLSIFLSYLWWIDCDSCCLLIQCTAFFVCKKESLCSLFSIRSSSPSHSFVSYRFVLVSAALRCKPFLNVDFHCYYLFPKLTLDACFKITNPNDVQRYRFTVPFALTHTDVTCTEIYNIINIKVILLLLFIFRFRFARFFHFLFGSGCCVTFVLCVCAWKEFSFARFQSVFLSNWLIQSLYLSISLVDTDRFSQTGCWISVGVSALEKIVPNHFSSICKFNRRKEKIRNFYEWNSTLMLLLLLMLMGFFPLV